MIRTTLIRTGVGLVATAAVLVGGPSLTESVGAGATGATMPAEWEQSKQRDAAGARTSQEITLRNEAERREAERKAKEAKEKARLAQEKARRAALAKAARARSAGGGTPSSNRALGMRMCADAGWSASQCADLGRLWQKESGWNHRAHNSGSGAYGIPQALPGSKMGSKGSDWATNPRTQIAWGLDYIRSRYGNPSNAWAHSVRNGWY